MTIDMSIVFIYLDSSAVIIAIANAIFLIIIARPLYKFSKERTALFILFSKTCINCFYQFISLYSISIKYFYKSFWITSQDFIVNPIYQLTFNAAYFHMAGLALNRFHSIFFPFSYQSFWKIKNVKRFILFIWLINLIWTGLQYTVFLIIVHFNKDAGIFNILFKGIFFYEDLPLLSMFSISAAIYLSILVKFVYNYYNRNNNTVITGNENVEKERVLIMIVCLVSLTPCPFLIIYNYLNTLIDNFCTNSIDNQTFLFTISAIIFNSIYTIIQFIEEICLLIMSKDFRKLVKHQFIKNIQQQTNSNVVGRTMFVSSQHYRQQQFNRQHINN